ncbi:hypothetical protein BDA99DRAFT_576497 [Phascolomyces articulosus]|uniref:Uncharacterized protein n=1 Tax=Phascolomyces articulosus TaxID=60185 RepID=A0AAD5P866_9FUNG|nr:hypothetical protein BDA99DRAFT_576497 [Phascolomyces articulosus]
MDCKAGKQGFEFAGYQRPYKTCMPCRFKHSDPEDVPLDRMVLLEDLNTLYSIERVVDDDDAIERVNNDEDPISDEELINCILEKVRACDQYIYFLKNVGIPALSSHISSTAYCHRSTGLQQQIPAHLARRFNPRLPIFEYNGRIKGVINKEHGYVHLNVNHSMNHGCINSQEMSIRHECPEVTRAFPRERANNREHTAASLYTACRYTTRGANNLKRVIVWMKIDWYQLKC